MATKSNIHPKLFNTMPTDHHPSKRPRTHLPPSYATLALDPRLATITEIESHYFTLTPHEGSLFRPCIIYLDRFRSLRVHPSFLEPSFNPGEDVTIVSPGNPIPEHDKLDCSWLDVV